MYVPNRRTYNPARPTGGEIIGVGCAALFSLPFAAAGTFFIYLFFSMLYDGIRARDWVVVPAKIVEVQSKVSTGGKSKSSTTTATYTYEYEGSKFDGHRVGLASGGDNIGSFQHDAYRELDSYRTSGQPFRVFVNPRNPSESVLYRDVRFGLLAVMLPFAVLFPLIGYGLLIGALISLVRAKRVRALVDRFPDEPWRHRLEWQDSRIKSGSAQAAIGAWVVVLFTAAFSAPILVLVQQPISEGNYWAALFLLMPAFTALLIRWAVVTTARWKRFGRAELHLQTVPARVGQELRADLLLPTQITERAAVKARLECVETQLSDPNARGENSRSVNTVWQEEQTVQLVRSAQAPFVQSVNVRFVIPSDCHATQDAKISRVAYRWTLRFSAELSGADLDLAFPVPVY